MRVLPQPSRGLWDGLLQVCGVLSSADGRRLGVALVVAPSTHAVVSNSRFSGLSDEPCGVAWFHRLLRELSAGYQQIVSGLSADCLRAAITVPRAVAWFTTCCQCVDSGRSVGDQRVVDGPSAVLPRAFGCERVVVGVCTARTL